MTKNTDFVVSDKTPVGWGKLKGKPHSAFLSPLHASYAQWILDQGPEFRYHSSRDYILAHQASVVKEQNILQDKRPVAQSGLREGLRSRSKKTDEQLAQELHQNLNKHKSVASVAKKVGKGKKKGKKK